MPGHVVGRSSGCPEASGHSRTLPAPLRSNMTRLAGALSRE